MVESLVFVSPVVFVLFYRQFQSGWSQSRWLTAPRLRQLLQNVFSETTLLLSSLPLNIKLQIEMYLLPNSNL